LNSHFLECEVPVAADAQAKPAQVVFNAERLGAALAMHFPLWESLAPLADGVLEIFPALTAGQRNSTHLINISTRSADADTTSSREDGLRAAPVKLESRM
jgi:hypothetical protein